MAPRWSGQQPLRLGGLSLHFKTDKWLKGRRPIRPGGCWTTHFRSSTRLLPLHRHPSVFRFVFLVRLCASGAMLHWCESGSASRCVYGPSDLCVSASLWGSAPSLRSQCEICSPVICFVNPPWIAAVVFPHHCLQPPILLLHPFISPFQGFCRLSSDCRRPSSAQSVLPGGRAQK